MKTSEGNTGQRRGYRMTARAESAEATGAAILDAAWEAFSTESFDQVTLKGVAAASGVSVQTVIRRFGSKEELFLAVGEIEGARVRASRDVPPGATFAEALDALLDHYEADGDAVLHLLAQELRFESVAAAVREGREVHRAWVEQHCGFAIGARAGPERELAIHAAIVATDLGTWKLLRRDLGMERAQVAAVMTTLVEGVKEGS